MLEARGNMLAIDCDAIVVTTNGFVKKSGACVMGRGIAKQLADILPALPYKLGDSIIAIGNQVFHYYFEGTTECIVTFPVKPINAINNGTNVVKHMSHLFPVSSTVPGFAAKAQLDIIEQSLKELVILTDTNEWTNVICPRFGCGAGELSWESVKPIVEKYLDDRFTIYTY